VRSCARPFFAGLRQLAGKPFYVIGRSLGALLPRRDGVPDAFGKSADWLSSIQTTPELLLKAADPCRLALASRS